MNTTEARSKLYSAIVEALDPQSDILAMDVCYAIEDLIRTMILEHQHED